MTNNEKWIFSVFNNRKIKQRVSLQRAQRDLAIDSVTYYYPALIYRQLRLPVGGGGGKMGAHVLKAYWTQTPRSRSATVQHKRRQKDMTDMTDIQTNKLSAHYSKILKLIFLQR